jgi:hypothetical protein
VGPRRNRIEPVAWAKKYLHVAPVLSEETFVGWYEINGINESKFISIPSQAISQLGAVKEIKVPKIRLIIKSRDEMGIIKEESSYNGGLSPMHLSATFMRVKCEIERPIILLWKSNVFYYTIRTNKVEEGFSWEGLQPTA